MHTIFLDDFGTRAGVVGSRVLVEGDEAMHALRVKRMRVGEMVRLIDGAGLVGRGRVEEAGCGSLVVVVEEVGRVEREGVRVEVCSATPKGNRLDKMIDGLAQVGAWAWSPLETARGVVDPRETKLERVGRIAREASKQCGRAWGLECLGKRTLAEALRCEGGERVVLADASGGWFRATGARRVRVLIGAEGGWSEEEMGMAREAGVEIARFGVHVMRIETAAVVAAGIVMQMEGLDGNGA